MKAFLFVLISSFLIIGCSSDDDAIENKILGVWKLTEIQQYAENPEGGIELSVINLEDSEIIYDFNGDYILTVSGADDSEYTPFTNGTYDYEFYSGSSSSATDPVEPISESVIIENLRWSFQWEGQKMSLSLAYVDGPTLIFHSQK